MISLEYKYLGGVQVPEMGTANHRNALSTFQILHNPRLADIITLLQSAIIQTIIVYTLASLTFLGLIFIKNLLDLLHKSDLFKPQILQIIQLDPFQVPFENCISITWDNVSKCCLKFNRSIILVKLK